MPAPGRLDLRLTLRCHPADMAYVDLIPERRADGTIVLRAVLVGPVERLRRFVRELAHGGRR